MKKKQILGLLLSLVLVLALVPAAHAADIVEPFTDVPTGVFYSDPVAWAVDEAITNGTSATMFSPEKVCTRGEIVTFLYRYAGKPAVSNVKNPFTDVAEGTFYYNAVLWAVANEITNGMTPTTFGPDNPCTRAHAVTFLYRYAQTVPEESVVYVLMNIPYDTFYRNVIGTAQQSGIDAVTSSTGKKAAYFWDGTVKGNAEVAFGADKTIYGVRFPVALSASDFDKLSTNLEKSDAYYAERLNETPALYTTATVSDNGGVTLNPLDAQATALSGATVSLSDESKHGDYLLTITNDGGVLSSADKATFAVYGAVLKTADKEYALRHLENLYYKDFNEIAFCTTSTVTGKNLVVDPEYFADLEGKTITEIDYYTNAGIFTIQTNVKVTPAAYALMNIPYDVFYSAEGTASFDADAVSSATNKVGNYGKAGGAFHSIATASVADDGTVTAVGGANGAHLEGVTWPVKVADAEQLALLGGKEITNDTTVTVATVGRGATSSTDLTGAATLMEAPAYSYYILDGKPDYYMELTVNGTTPAFSALVGRATTVDNLEAGVSYATNWGDVQLDLSKAAEVSDKQVNAMVITTKDGASAGMIHLYNVWSNSDIGWRVANVQGLDGTTITNIRYYCNDKNGNYFVYDYPVSLDILPIYTGEVTAAFADSGTVEVTGLPADIQNPTAKVYHTTGGRNPVLTYLTPTYIDPADGDVEPETVPVTDGKIALTNAPEDGKTYVVVIGSDNYFAITISAEYVNVDGDYTATATVQDVEGDFADYDITVQVTVSDGKISDLKVTEYGTAYDSDNDPYMKRALTSGRGGVAGIAAQVQGQDATGALQIDAVTSATCSSKALIEAIDAALAAIRA